MVVSNFMARGGESFSIAMKGATADPWAIQSGAAFTLTALTASSTLSGLSALGADFALTTVTGEQASTAGQSISFSVTAGLDRYALVMGSGSVFANVPSVIGPLASFSWAGTGPLALMSSASQAASTSVTVQNVVPGIYEVWGREASKNWGATTSADIKIEWKAPTTNTPIQSTNGIQIVCNSGCVAADTVEQSNPTATAYQSEWNPFSNTVGERVSQAQYETESFDMYNINLKFPASLSTSANYNIYFAEVSNDVSYYTTVPSDATTDAATDSTADYPGSEIGLSRSPCDTVGRASSTVVGVYTGTPNAVNQRIIPPATTVPDWNSKQFTDIPAYKPVFSGLTASSSLVKAAGASDDFGFLQFGADNCQNANGISETWVFPHLSSFGLTTFSKTYQACFQSSNTAGRRIFKAGASPAAGLPDERTYVQVTTSIPVPEEDSASQWSIMGALVVAVVAMVL